MNLPDGTDAAAMDPREQAALERERHRLAQILYARGMITTSGPDAEPNVQVAFDRQSEEAGAEELTTPKVRQRDKAHRLLRRA